MPPEQEQQQDQPSQRGLLPALGWACYLGCSWTWVIGMLFPSLLLRDYGPWGFWAFAIPNVVGAAAMGWVLKDSAAAQRVVMRHRPMLQIFSEVTIAYHVFVVLWLGLRVGGEWFVLLTPAIAAAMFMFQKNRMVVNLSLVVALFSLGLIGMNLQDVLASASVMQDAAPKLTTFDLMLLLPATLAGFLCCPYLDLTFHRARIATSPGGGRLAFGIGFGVVFFAMILFAAVYGSRVTAIASFWSDGSKVEVLGETTPRWLSMLPVFLMVQIAFTLAVHTQERLRTGRIGDAVNTVIAIAIGAGLGVMGLVSESTGVAGETIYRGFLLLYGTVFPLYVILMMLPRLNGTTTCPKRRFAVFITASIASYLLAWIGYVHFQPVGAIGAVVVFVVARAVIEVLPAE